MATRMQKYYYEDKKFGSRTEKNQELYKEIAESDIDKFELSSNATVLSDAKNNIDIDKIKKILDTKYKEVPKRKTIKIDTEEEQNPEPIIDTKEYDINAILEKAKEEKESNYDSERLKKIRDTQYDILNHLQLDKEEKNDQDSEAEKDSDEKDDLMGLINTITAKELENKGKEDLDPLDILTDLKGEGEVTSPIEKSAIDNFDEESEDEKLLKLALEKREKEKNAEINKSIDSTQSVDNSFFTSTTSFTNSDFDDFNDLKAEVNSHKNIIIVVVVLLMIIIVVAVILGLNHFLDLGLF